MSDPNTAPLEGGRAAVMIGPLFEDVEATYPYYRLQEAGADVELIGVESGASLTGKKGAVLTTDRAASELSADDLDLLVIAGGYGPDKLRSDDGVQALVRAMDERGSPIAFICHAGWVPVSAGIVGGRRVTSIPRSPTTCATPAPSGRTARSSSTATWSPRGAPRPAGVHARADRGRRRGPRADDGVEARSALAAVRIAAPTATARRRAKASQKTSS